MGFILIYRKYDSQGQVDNSSPIIEREIDQLDEAPSHSTELQAQGYELEASLPVYGDIDGSTPAQRRHHASLIS
jgi:hypothetical protein